MKPIKAVFLSDTHMSHHDIEIPDGDILCFAGDACVYGYERELNDFIDWFSALPHPQKIFVAGNHDKCLESGYPHRQNLLNRMTEKSIHYLEDSGTTMNGISFYGIPWTPRFGDNWAFNVTRNKKDEQRIWSRVPEGLDVLISHGPPHGSLDVNRNSEHVGSEEMEIVLKSLDSPPKLVVCGHVHPSYGIKFPLSNRPNDTIYANVSIDQTSSPKNYEVPISFNLLRSQEGLKISVIDLHKSWDFSYINDGDVIYR